MPKNFDWRTCWRNTWPILAIAAVGVLGTAGLTGLAVVYLGWEAYDIVKG